MSPRNLIGKQAPDFTAKDSDGNDFTLSSVVGKGKPVGLFFFPKAGTSVCDAESCSFESNFPSTADLPAKVNIVGVTSGTPAELAPWKTKNKLSYPIIADTARAAKEAFGIGKGPLGLTEARVTIYIDSNGIVKDVVDGALASVSSAKHVNLIKDNAAKDGISA